LPHEAKELVELFCL